MEPEATVPTEETSPAAAPAPNSPTTMEGVATSARGVLKGAGAFLAQVGQKAKEAAVVGGQQIAKASVTVGEKASVVSAQV